MEAKKDNDENSALLERLVGNDYDAFLALSMLSNHENGRRYLEEFIASIGDELSEKAIYFETGKDSWLIYPVPSSHP